MSREKLFFTDDSVEREGGRSLWDGMEVPVEMTAGGSAESIDRDGEQLEETGEDNAAEAQAAEN